jgi:WD40 repeat protein
LTCGETSGLQRWPITTNTTPGIICLGAPQRIALPFIPHRFARMGSNGLLAVVGEASGQAALLDSATDTVLPKAIPHEFACFVDLSPCGRFLATSGWHAQQVKLWDTSSGLLLREWRTGKQTRAFFTPESRELLIARGQEFAFHDVETLKPSRQMPREHCLYPGHAAFTSDGRMMALEMSPGIVHLVEVDSGRTVARLEDPHGDQPSWMGFTPDGTQLIIAASVAGAIHRWDLRALRARLKAMHLDWDWPAFPTSVGADPGLAKSKTRIQVRVEAGSLVPSPAGNP